MEFMFYKIHTYTKTNGINKRLTAASPTPIIISKVTFRFPRILLSKNAIQSIRTYHKFYYYVCLEESCAVRSAGCVGFARTLSTQLTKTENFDISHVPFIHQEHYFYPKLTLRPDVVCSCLHRTTLLVNVTTSSIAHCM